MCPCYSLIECYFIIMVATILGYSTREFQALQLIVLAVFGIVD